MVTGKEEMRFGFGKNWSKYIEKHLSDEIVEASIQQMRDFMRRESLEGKTFIDIGCGSGIHSLAALKLGAKKVYSFDYDENSVATSRKVREWSGYKDNWEITQGDALDEAYMRSLPKFDIVYSWGVLHHTGDQWRAIKNATLPLKEDSEFYIALYSYENYVDPTPEEWVEIKKKYNLSNPIGKKNMEFQQLYRAFVEPHFETARVENRNLLSIFAEALKDYNHRGMDAWTDIKDWLGGYPIEFSKVSETAAHINDYCDFEMVNILTGEGCTEYIFANPAKNNHWAAVKKNRKMFPLKGPFNVYSDHAYSIALPETKVKGDHVNNNCSTLMMFEDGQPLGFAHCVHATICEVGEGRFSHWGTDLIFSTTDNTNPNDNGRQYSYCEVY